ncbi:unnamed protein product [Lathyrus oleraceus]
MVCDCARKVWCITGLMSHRVLLPSVSVLAIFLNSVRISPCRELRLHLYSVLFFFCLSWSDSGDMLIVDGEGFENSLWRLKILRVWLKIDTVNVVEESRWKWWFSSAV